MKMVVSTAAALLLGSSLVAGLSAAERTQKIIVDPPRSSWQATNLSESLAMPLQLQEAPTDSLMPQTSPGMGRLVSPPSRPQPPSRRERDAAERKRNWALNDPTKSQDLLGTDSLLKDRDASSAAQLSGTPQGFIEAYFHDQAKGERRDQEAAIRQLLSDPNDSKTPSGFSSDNSIAPGELRRSSYSGYQADAYSPFNTPDRRSSTSPLLKSQFDQASQREQRIQAFRDILERATPTKADSVSKLIGESDPKSAKPQGALADLNARPTTPGVNPNSVFQPVERAVSGVTPFGNPAALRSQTALGGVSRSAPAPIKPFAPLPSRNF
jgi:hypothetical protein